MLSIALLTLSLLVPQTAGTQASDPQTPSAGDPGLRSSVPRTRDVPVVELPIVEITVYPDSALVRRRGALPRGASSVVVPGLPPSLAPESLRVASTGGELVRLELVERAVERLADPRLEGLRAELESVRDALRGLEAERLAAAELRKYWLRLLEGGLVGEDAGATERVEGSLAALVTVRAELEALGLEVERLRRDGDGLRARERELQSALGALAVAAPRRVLDLHCELASTTADSAGSVTIDYVVPDARWEPFYDLRSSADLAAVELVHRARVRQTSGEDWTGVALTLSTAEPRRGAIGPEPRGEVLGLHRSPPEGTFRYAVDAERGAALRSLGYVSEEDAAVAEADVRADGLHLAYRVPRAETLPSRPEPTEVLIGRRALDVAPERYAVPARDPSVWVRGRTTNTTGWTLLAGEANVYVGGTFLGTAPIPRSQPEGELELALGIDPRLSVERALIEEERDEPGLFGSKVVERRRWRVTLTSTADEPVEVLVHEALPTTTDVRIEVEIDRARPGPLAEPRWQSLREEQGLLTFGLEAPPGGTARLEWTQVVRHPEDLALTRR